MTATINASTSSGVVTSADTSGVLALQSNGTTKLTVDSTGAYGQLVSGTAVASTSGTSIDFTSIPSWVKRITVMFNEVSTNGTTAPQIQLGTSGGVQITGYVGTLNYTGGVINLPGTGFNIYSNGTWTAASTISGTYVFTLLDSSNGTWICNGGLGASNAAAVGITCGRKILSGTLDRVRITMNGTEVFDAGSINILYEG